MSAADQGTVTVIFLRLGKRTHESENARPLQLTTAVIVVPGSTPLLASVVRSGYLPSLDGRSVLSIMAGFIGAGHIILVMFC